GDAAKESARYEAYSGVRITVPSVALNCPTRYRGRNGAKPVAELTETANETTQVRGRPSIRSRTSPVLAHSAVAVGFEPTEALTSHDFESRSLGHSDTLPHTSVTKP